MLSITQEMTNYDAEINIIIDLQKRGFDHDFIFDKEYIRCLQYNQLIAPDDFEILEIHHCEQQINITYNTIIFGVRLYNYDIKGILMTTYNSLVCGFSIHLWKKIFKTIQESVDRKPGTLQQYKKLQLNK